MAMYYTVFNTEDGEVFQTEHVLGILNNFTKLQ